MHILSVPTHAYLWFSFWFFLANRKQIGGIIARCFGPVQSKLIVQKIWIRYFGKPKRRFILSKLFLTQLRSLRIIFHIDLNERDFWWTAFGNMFVILDFLYHWAQYAKIPVYICRNFSTLDYKSSKQYKHLWTSKNYFVCSVLKIKKIDDCINTNAI